MLLPLNMETLVVWPRKIPKKMHVKLQMINDSPLIISVYILEMPRDGNRKENLMWCMVLLHREQERARTC